MRISPKLFSLKKYFSFSSVKRRPNKLIEFSGPFFFNLSGKLHECKTGFDELLRYQVLWTFISPSACHPLRL